MPANIDLFRNSDKGQYSPGDWNGSSGWSFRKRTFIAHRISSVLPIMIVIATTFCVALVQGQSSDHRNPPEQQPPLSPNVPKIWVVGDSTANNHANGGLGWGDPFISFFDPSKVNVVNRARGGPSSRTFITEGLWDRVVIEMKKGDFVLIQFGHNDAGAINDDTRARGSLPGIGDETQAIDNLLTRQHEVVHTYGWYLRKMMADVKTKAATPIVLSLTVRNIWKDNHVERGPGRFGEWAAQIAKSENVTFMDVTKLIADKYEELGETEVSELFATDHTHTNSAGAQLNASLVVAGLKMLKGQPLKRYFSEKSGSSQP